MTNISIVPCLVMCTCHTQITNDHENQMKSRQREKDVVMFNTDMMQKVKINTSSSLCALMCGRHNWLQATLIARVKVFMHHTSENN